MLLCCCGFVAAANCRCCCFGCGIRVQVWGKRRRRSRRKVAIIRIKSDVLLLLLSTADKVQALKLLWKHLHSSSFQKIDASSSLSFRARTRRRFNQVLHSQPAPKVSYFNVTLHMSGAGFNMRSSCQYTHTHGEVR